MPEATCWICSSEKFVDDHHYDCREGRLSPETVPLCRRCHRTYHDRGIEWFDDKYLDKAIEIENKFRVIHNANLKEPLTRIRHKYIDSLYSGKELQPIKREDIQRTDYWNKKHGIKRPHYTAKETKGSQTPAFTFALPHGEPLCGQQWVEEHLYDLIDWVPRIEITSPGFHLIAYIDSKAKLRDVSKAIRGMK